MKIMKVFRMIRNRVMQSTNPIGWARKIGVNFPGGGATPLWQNKLEYRTLDNNAWKQCSHY